MVLGFTYLLRGDLHAQVSARHHDAVGHLQDFVKVGQAGGVLNLADDFDALPACIVQHLRR